MMAPVTCKVIGPSHFGIEGVHVALECKDQYMNIIARFWAFTDSVGIVQRWVPNLPHGFLPSADPQSVDTQEYPWMRMRFFAGPYSPPNPWMNVQADMYLPDNTYHGVILYLDLLNSSYHVRHTSQPEMISGHVPTTSEKIIEMVDSGVDRSPSPLQLRPPATAVQAEGRGARANRKQSSAKRRRAGTCDHGETAKRRKCRKF